MHDTYIYLDQGIYTYTDNEPHQISEPMLAEMRAIASQVPPEKLDRELRKYLLLRGDRNNSCVSDSSTHEQTT